MTFPKRLALFSSILAVSCVIWGAYELLNTNKSHPVAEEGGGLSFPKLDWSELRKSKSALGELKLVPCDPALLSQIEFLQGPKEETVKNIDVATPLPIKPLFSLARPELMAREAPPQIFEYHQIQKWALPISATTSDPTMFQRKNVNVEENEVEENGIASRNEAISLAATPIPESVNPSKEQEIESLGLSPLMVPPTHISLEKEDLPYSITAFKSSIFTLKSVKPAVATLQEYSIPNQLPSVVFPEKTFAGEGPQQEKDQSNLTTYFASSSFVQAESIAFPSITIESPQAKDTSLYVIRNPINPKFLNELHEKAPLPLSILEQLPQTEERDVFYSEETFLATGQKKLPQKEQVKRIARRNATPMQPAKVFSKDEIIVKGVEPSYLLIQTKKITTLEEKNFNAFLHAVDSSRESFVETDLLADVQIDQWQEHCSFNLQYTKDPYGQGYFFVVTVEPTFTSSENNLRQNLYFLVDRSNSIEKHKYSVFKKAVMRALKELDISDNFNILVFDHQVMSFQKEAVPATSSNIDRAESFLEDQGHGNFLAAGDVYKSLRHLVPTKVNTNELHSAILITDGNSLLTASKKQKAVQRWKDQFGGSVNLFTAAVGKGNNLNLLSLFSSVGQGKLIYSDTHASFPRKIAMAVKALRAPLAKNLHAFVKSSTSTVDLLTENQFTPPLFNEQPVTFLGYAQDLSDFTFVLEGKNKDGWFEIRKNFSFNNAKSARIPVEKAVEFHRAQMHYRRFIEKGLEQDLDEAENCLRSAESRWNFD